MTVDGYHELPPERRRMRRLSAELRERESVMPLELFFDLVFVLALTQCTALMAHDATWSGLGKGILALAVIWWAWVCYAWLTSVVEPEQGAARVVLLVAMAGMLVVALCVPEAFGDRGLTFAVAYGLVRALHIALFVKVSRDVPEFRRTVLTFACTTTLAVALLIVASFADGSAQVGFWIAALLVDSLGASVRVDGWRLVPRHFAERHNLVIILALGESIVALGIGAQVELDASVITGAVLGMGLAAALWWIYFDVVALVTERRLIRAEPGPQRNRLARDSYSYLHFPMVAGIVLSAFGLHEVLVHTHEPLDDVFAFALLGGPAIYLLAHVALRLRNAHTVNPERLGLALVFFALIPAAMRVDALWTMVGVDVLLWAMIAYETLYVYDERRYLLRHGVDIEAAGEQ
jgi:low temperature requirement protein LtrA